MADGTGCAPIEALIVAVPETAGSALYGMFDVLAATGNLWQQLVGTEPERRLIRPRIVSTAAGPFRCGNGIPVTPHVGLGSDPAAGIVILPELWLAPDQDLKGRYPDLMAWIRRRYAAGAVVYSACSGSIMLAETGLLDGRGATSHWGYRDLFRRSYPEVRFQPEPALVFADPAGRIVTAGGATSWHDLAIHIVARHCSPGEALRIAKVYLLKWHAEGQLPYASLVRRSPHADSVVRSCEDWLSKHFRQPNAIAAVVAAAKVPERTLKRRFKAATGVTPIDYVHNLRVEEAKRLLETGPMPFDGISADVGYENPGFFRRLFKRSTGLTPGQYRRMFQPFALASTPADVAVLDPARPDRRGPPVAGTAHLGPRAGVGH
ncbi:MAG TPA: helix-turn-helix domain-containing protein [Geminicoccaceae bacterium]|nr:helix-turn-helix domain-containing protein [Geminicoccaceae bacterium]